MSRILLIATGGTIASTAEKDGLAPTLTGRELAERVPLLDTLCELDFVQPMNIDSTNMRPHDWLRIAATIREAYDRYDGFVILHGTDTMAYTAAALSYLVRDSEKPIVLTGSQQPMANPFTDAKLNLYHSVLYACDPASRDVSVPATRLRPRRARGPRDRRDAGREDRRSPVLLRHPRQPRDRAQAHPGTAPVDL